MPFRYAPSCCPCQICWNKTFGIFSEDIGEAIQTLDDRWEAVAGSWTVQQKADPYDAGDWSANLECLRTGDENALLVHKDGPRKAWPITLELSYYGAAAGDQIRLVFDYADEENYQYAQVTLGTEPAYQFNPPHDQSAYSENPGQLAIFQVSGGEATQKTATALRPETVGDGPHKILVSITRADYGTDEDDQPQLLITATWGTTVTGGRATVSYLGTVSGPRCGAATGALDAASAVEFDLFEGTWSPRVTSQQLVGYYGKCSSAIQIAAAYPENVGDATAATVNSGQIVSGDYTSLWHYDDGEMYWKWGPYPDLVLAPLDGQLQAELTFRLANNPNATKVVVIGKYETQDAAAYFDAEVYDHEAAAWEKPPYSSDADWAQGQAILRPYLTKFTTDARPGYGILARHVDGEGYVKLRLTADSEHEHAASNRLRLKGAWVFNQRAEPEQYTVEMIYTGSGSGGWLEGVHTLDRVEGWPASYVYTFGDKPAYGSGESWWFLGVEPSWYWEPRTIVGSRKAPGLAIEVRLYRWDVPNDPSWGGYLTYTSRWYVAAVEGQNNSLWVTEQGPTSGAYSGGWDGDWTWKLTAVGPPP